MYQISFRSINSLMSYHPDNITFPNSKSKRGNNSDGIWWSVTRFELDLPFTFLYICAKFHLDPWILSWVIIRTSSFSSILSKKRGHNSVRIWWSVTRFELELPFMGIYICGKYHLDLFTLSGVIIRTSSFYWILS